MSQEVRDDVVAIAFSAITAEVEKLRLQKVSDLEITSALAAMIAAYVPENSLLAFTALVNKNYRARRKP